MTELAGERPEVRSRARPHAIERITKTLREHYEEKRAHYATRYSEAYDEQLRRVFDADRSKPHHPTAASFIRRHRRELRELICEWSGEYAFTVDHLLKEMTTRCTELRLRTGKPVAKLKLDFAVFLSIQTVSTVYRGPGWHPL